MNIPEFHALQSEKGVEVLEAAVNLAPREKDFLRHFQALSRRFPPEIARAALETAILRGEGMQKFPSAEKMFFTRQALQQASGWEIASYRAARYSGMQHIFDLGCSIGGDTLALGQVAQTTAIDLDRLRLLMACANVESQGIRDRVNFVQVDLLSDLPLRYDSTQQDIAAFFDPARREGHQRIFSVRDYHPPLHMVNEWLRVIPAIGVKISPGVDLDEIRSYDAEVEFISVRGELKEAVLWFGPFKSTRFRATLLPGPHTLYEETDQPLPVSEPQEYIYEPDPAVLRAGLVATLGYRFGANQLDPTIAYLTSDRFVDSPFTRVWKIETWFPFGLKRLRSYLRERGIGDVVIKKRGSPLEPDALKRELRLKGEQERVLFLTQCMGKPIVVVAYKENDGG